MSTQFPRCDQISDGPFQLHRVHTRNAFTHDNSAARCLQQQAAINTMIIITVIRFLLFFIYIYHSAVVHSLFPIAKLSPCAFSNTHFISYITQKTVICFFFTHGVINPAQCPTLSTLLKSHPQEHSAPNRNRALTPKNTSTLSRDFPNKFAQKSTPISFARHSSVRNKKRRKLNSAILTVVRLYVDGRREKFSRVQSGCRVARAQVAGRWWDPPGRGGSSESVRLHGESRKQRWGNMHGSGGPEISAIHHPPESI